MTKNSRTAAVFAVLGTAPWVALSLIFVIAPMIGYLSDGLGIFLLFVGVVWAIIWIIRSSKRFIQMLHLASTGTPAPMLHAAALILETWPTLVRVNNWVPRSALGQEPTLNAKIWGFITGNRSSLGPQVARVEEAPAGLSVFVNLTPSCSAEHIAAGSTHIADVWGAQAVEVTRPKPGMAHILVKTRDPLAGASPTYAPTAQSSFAPPPPPPNADDFLSIWSSEHQRYCG